MENTYLCNSIPYFYKPLEEFTRTRTPHLHLLEETIYVVQFAISNFTKSEYARGELLE